MDPSTANLSSFTREEATFLRVAAAFVTVHHHSLHTQKRPREEEENDYSMIPLIPSRPTTLPSMNDHIHSILHTMTLRERTGSSRWKSLAQHLAQQLMQWDQTPQFIQEHTTQYAIWEELIHIRPCYFAPLLVPLLWPQRTNGYAWQLLELALARAPLPTIEDTIQELIAVPPLPNDLAVYYVSVSSDGSNLLSKWAQDNLLQQLLKRLHEGERAPGRGC